MTLAAPVMLWSLLALSPLVAVYFLKVRPRRRPTTAFFLWAQVLSDKKPSRLWERLRNVASLLMMAAAFAAIALAMAGPRVGDASADDLLIVVDNSASMSAGQGGATRLGAAKAEARDLARAMNGVQRAAVATMAGRLRYASHLSDNPRELIAAIDRIGPTHEALRVDRLRAAAATANAGVASDNGLADGPLNQTDRGDLAGASPDSSRRRVVFLTDGSHDGLPAGVEPLVVGDDAPNVGLVGADLRFSAEDPDRLMFYYQVASTHDGPLDVDLLLYHEPDGEPRRLAKVVPVEASPGVGAPRVLAVEAGEAGRWVAELDTESLAGGDALAGDNTAYLIAYKEPPIRVRVAAEESYFFDRAVEAFATFGGGLTAVTGDQPADVVLAHGAPPEDAQRVVLFAPRGRSAWWGEAGEEFDVAAPRVVAEGHPVIREIDPLSIDFAGARRLTPPAGSEVLVRSDTGQPLIYVAKRPGEAAVVVNLEPVAAEFYYSAWFPVLVRAAAKHLVGREAALAATRSPGESLALPLTADDPPAAVTGPGGFSRELSGTTIEGLPAPGFYRVEAGPRVIELGVSQLAADETLLDSKPQAAPPEGLASGFRLDHWLVAAALVGVTCESLLYHRRKVG
ncbi:BatA and WFA domain-containing protein [Botrimarina sp.]|uniref:BatA and WFA domain-containing protein n=1 Tax=Botrimarina sp. TaxID=2795802 RepID=UPI0032EF2308